MTFCCEIRHKKNQAIFWMKLAYDYHEKYLPSDNEKCIMFLALFLEGSKDYIKAEGLFREALRRMEDDKVTFF